VNAKRTLAVVAAAAATLVLVAVAAHYVVYGSLPLGKPALLGDG